jgi:hypothetical protein
VDVIAKEGIEQGPCNVKLVAESDDSSNPKYYKNSQTQVQTSVEFGIVRMVSTVDESLKNVVVMQARPNDWSSLEISWNILAVDSTRTHTPDMFDIQLSTETSFDPDFSNTMRVKLPDDVFKTKLTITDTLRTRLSPEDFKSPLEIWQQVVYVRVRSVTTNTTSAWSVPSEPWTVAGKCGGRYLGTTGVDMRTWECQACPRSANCATEEWLALHTLSPKRNFARVAWEYDGYKDEPFDRCPFKWNCNTGNDARDALSLSSNDTSRAVRLLDSATTDMLFNESQCFNNSAGVLCALCKPNYVRRGQTCELCVASDVALKLGCIALVAIIALIIVCVCRVRLRRLRRKYGPLWRDVVRIVTINVTFMQINASLPSVLSDLGLPTVYLDFLSNFDFVNLDLMTFFSLPCLADSIDFRVSVVVAGMAPVIVVVCAMFAYAHRRWGITRTVSRVGNSETLRLEAAQYLFDLLDTEGDQMIDVDEFRHLLAFLGVPAKQIKNKEYVRKAMSKMMGGGTAGTGNAEKTLSRQQFLHGITHGAVADLAGTGNKWVMVTEKERVKTSYLSSVMLVFLLIHAPVSQRVFYYMSFRTVKGKRFLTKDFSIQFGNEVWLSFLPVVMIIAVVFTLGFPTTIGYLLFKNRKHLQSAHMRRRLGFLYRPFAVGAEYWELHEVFRKMLLTGVIIFVPPDVRAAVAVLVCVLSVATLNFARPHLNKVVFWVAEMSFLLTCFKYLTAIFIATRTSGVLDTESDNSLAYVLIALDVAMLLGSVASSVAVLFVLGNKSGSFGAKLGGLTGKRADELDIAVVPRRAADGNFSFRKKSFRLAGLGRQALADKKARDLEDDAEQEAKRMRKRLEVQHAKANARLQNRIQRRKTNVVDGRDAEGSKKNSQPQLGNKVSRHSPPATGVSKVVPTRTQALNH